MKSNEGNLYNELAASDVLTPIVQHIRSGRFSLHADGKITESSRLAFERPWLTAVVDKERNCSKWLEIYFKIYQIIPKGCRNCWKIAFRPKTLEDAFKVLELQKSMGISSKTGLECRAATGHKGGYSSFWYANLGDGLEKAKELFREVEVKLHKCLRYTDGLMLKRGCTEMEHFSSSLFGNSTCWDTRAEAFDLTEQLLDSVFDIPELYLGDMPQIVTNYIKRNWIEWAYEHDDETYLKYTGGHRIVAPLCNYMNIKNSEIKIPLTWEGTDELNTKLALDSIV